MEGFTIQNGLAQGTTGGGDFSTFASGGLWAQNSSVTLKTMIFRNNRATGGSTTQSYGGGGSGGGLAIQSSKSGIVSTLENVVFSGNQASAVMGPIGWGGPRRRAVLLCLPSGRQQPNLCQQPSPAGILQGRLLQRTPSRCPRWWGRFPAGSQVTFTTDRHREIIAAGEMPAPSPGLWAAAVLGCLRCRECPGEHPKGLIKGMPPPGGPAPREALPWGRVPYQQL